MAIDEGAHPNRFYRGHDGAAYLNGAAFYNDAGEDISFALEGFGPGGAVTQITSAATGVTLNKKRGQITTVALTTAAAAEEVFEVTNSEVAATDIISLSTTYAGAGTPMLSVKGVGAGVFTIVITNVHAANALNALMVINFIVHKGAAS